MPDSVRQRQGVTLAIRKEGRTFQASVMLSRYAGGTNTLRELFTGSAPFADALRTAQRLSEVNGQEGYFEITDETKPLGKSTFATLEEWQAVMQEIQRQLEPLKTKSGFSWGGGQPITHAHFASIPGLGPHLERLMELHADVLKRQPVTL